jgi:hypothetical protein
MLRMADGSLGSPLRIPPRCACYDAMSFLRQMGCRAGREPSGRPIGRPGGIWAYCSRKARVKLSISGWTM